MTHTEKVSMMFHLLEDATNPMTKDEILARIGKCHRSTFGRIKDDVFSISNREVLPDKKTRPYGYYLEPADNRTKAVPNILMRDKEIEALIIIQQMAESLVGGFLGDTINDFTKAIEKKIEDQKIKLDDWKNRIKVVPIAAKSLNNDVFKYSVASVLKRKRMKIAYASPNNEEKPQKRIISPQTLLLYRDNWYLDAYCHSKNDIRTFLLSRIEFSELTSEEAFHVDKKDLIARYATSYGIFSGQVQSIAKIRFTGLASKVVIQEMWHSDQIIKKQSDDSLMLEVPYARSDELLMDILRWGAEAEVLGPVELRDEICGRIKKMNKVYECCEN